MVDLNEITSQELGKRLKLARENANIKQDEAAQMIEVSRPTLVSIEQGARRVRIQELQILARKYGTSVNALLRRDAVHTDLLPRFRKMRENEDAYTLEAAQLLSNLVKADVELENILGIKRERNYPPERGISQGDVVVLAEKHSQEFRQFLGLGPGPIADIFSLIELTLGIRLYQRRLSSKSKVAGLFTFDEEIGACILINANHPYQRRVQSAAHELGHFIGTRQNPEVLELDEKFLSRDEKYANAFGRAFLTPAESFKRSFEILKAASVPGKLPRRLVILLANQYSISREACVRRLEELALIPNGSWNYFLENGGITDKQAEEVLGEAAHRADPAKLDADRPLSHRMSLMAHNAWKQDLLSEGQLAELLQLERVELRSVIDEIELEDEESNELLKHN